MKIAVIGAGFTGLTATLELIKKNHQAVVFEKDGFAGGLASGIRQVVEDYPKDWEWDLERFYHHWFTNHRKVIQLAKDLGIEDKIFQKETVTAILSQNQIYPYDSAIDYLEFPNLPLIDKIRGAKILALLKFFPFWQLLERFSAALSLEKLMGKRAFEMPWRSLLVGKFGDYWQKVNLAWFQSRISERTKKLMYIEGGFQTLTDAMINYIRENRGEIRFNAPVEKMKPLPDQKWLLMFSGRSEVFDKVIFTASPSLLARLAPSLPVDYKNLLEKRLVTMAAQSLIIALDKPLMENVYWLSINDLSYPFLVLVEHTNFIDPKYFGGNHLVYVGEYLDVNHTRMKMSKEELLELYLPYLEKIHLLHLEGVGGTPSRYNVDVKQSWLFREPYAQPVFPINYSKDIPSLKTLLPNLYLASMNQVYPHDRGTEHAIELGKKVSEFILTSENA